jgi:periplasmic protein TonB
MKHVAILLFLLTPLSLVAQTSLDPVDDSVYTEVDQMPEFPGGKEALLKFVYKNVRYPASARRMGIQGTVWLTCIVEKDGSVSNVKVKESLSTDTDNESIRVLSMSPKWIPGESGGVPVRVRMEHPVKFKLAE